MFTCATNCLTYHIKVTCYNIVYFYKWNSKSHLIHQYLVPLRLSQGYAHKFMPFQHSMIGIVAKESFPSNGKLLLLLCKLSYFRLATYHVYRGVLQLKWGSNPWQSSYRHYMFSTIVLLKYKHLQCYRNMSELNSNTMISNSITYSTFVFC